MDIVQESNSTLWKEYKANDVTMKGWMSKKGTFLGWNRRYFLLAGNVLVYYNKEGMEMSLPRDMFRIIQVHPLVSHKNALLLQLKNGKEVHIRADTVSSYKMWLEGFKTACITTTSSTKKEKTCTAQYYDDKKEEWERRTFVLQEDQLSAYDTDRTMELSGRVRRVTKMENDDNGITIDLNKNRRIYVSFDNKDQHLNWLLALEFAVARAQAISTKKRRASKSPSSRDSSSGRNSSVHLSTQYPLKEQTNTSIFQYKGPINSDSSIKPSTPKSTTTPDPPQGQEEESWI